VGLELQKCSREITHLGEEKEKLNRKSVNSSKRRGGHHRREKEEGRVSSRDTDGGNGGEKKHNTQGRGGVSENKKPSLEQ